VDTVGFKTEHSGLEEGLGGTESDFLRSVNDKVKRVVATNRSLPMVMT
jgi:hypothetical protein